MHKVRLSQLLRGMFFTAYCTFWMEPTIQKTTDNATVLSYEFKQSESS